MVRWQKIISVRVRWADDSEEILKLISNQPWKPNGRITELIVTNVDYEDIFDHKGEYVNEYKD